MSNIYSTPEQPPLNPEQARLWLLGDARFTIQNALLRQHKQIAVDLARQRVMDMQIIEKSADVPTLAPNDIGALRPQAVPVSTERLPLSAEQTSQEATRQQLIAEAYERINEAHAA